MNHLQMALFFLTLLLFAWAGEAQEEAKSGAVSIETQRQILELEKAAIAESAELRAEIRQEIEAELTAHRKYLQELDDKFYSRIKFWMPIASAAIAVLFGIFLWQVGKTQKEAFEGAQLVAITKATELATHKVQEIVVPEHILDQANNLAAESLQQLSEISESLIGQLREELTAARDQVVQDKDAMIVGVLNDALEKGFADELNVVERIAALEDKLAELEEVNRRSARVIALAAADQVSTKGFSPYLQYLMKVSSGSPVTGVLGTMGDIALRLAEKERERKHKEALDELRSAMAKPSEDDIDRQP